eukprot:Sspe_Gene.116358::Locus_105429_Transcript_1_2_Confidence_0.857_Length_367::g.116358::m.116358
MAEEAPLAAPPDAAPQDWVCPNCNNVNFANRTVHQQGGGGYPSPPKKTTRWFRRQPGGLPPLLLPLLPPLVPGMQHAEMQDTPAWHGDGARAGTTGSPAREATS